MQSTQDDDNQATLTPARSGFMDEKLFKSRAITLFGSIDDKLARSVTERLLALASDGDDPITLYVSSPGGHVESGDVIYDMINFIQPAAHLKPVFKLILKSKCSIQIKFIVIVCRINKYFKWLRIIIITKTTFKISDHILYFNFS